MNKFWIMLWVVVGCYGNGSEGEAEAEFESGIESGSESESESEGEVGLRYAAVLTVSSDFLSGGFSVVDVDTLAVQKNVGPASGDAVGRVWFGRYFIINRSGEQGGSVQVHDAKSDFALVHEFSVGSESNPQDICCVSANKCYVTRLNAGELAIVDPLDTMTGSIDMSKMTQDGLPNAYSCHVAGDRLLVTLENLDETFSPLPPGLVALVDSATDSLLGSHETAAINPFSRFAVEPGEETAILGEVGYYGVLDGGLDRIDLVTGESQGLIVTEKALGSDAGRIAVCPSGEVFVITTTAEFATELRRVNLDEGAVGEVLVATPGFNLTWLAPDDRGRLWVADQRVDGSPTGVWIYNCDGTQVTEQPIDVGGFPAYEGVIEFL